MSEELTQHLPNDDLRRILARLDSIDARLNTVETRLTSVETRLTSVDERLGTLEGKVERRSQETRPIWEQVLGKLENLENEMGTGFRRLERQLGELAKDVIVVRADQRDLEKRVDKLESEPTQ